MMYAYVADLRGVQGCSDILRPSLQALAVPRQALPRLHLSPPLHWACVGGGQPHDKRIPSHTASHTATQHVVLRSVHMAQSPRSFNPGPAAVHLLLLEKVWGRPSQSDETAGLTSVNELTLELNLNPKT